MIRRQILRTNELNALKGQVFPFSIRSFHFCRRQSLTEAHGFFYRFKPANEHRGSRQSISEEPSNITVI